MSKTKTYIEFFFLGLIFDQTSVKEVSDRDVEKVKVPQGAFGFMFFDVKSTEEDGVVNRLNVSPMYYYGGRIMTLAEVRREMPELDTLIANMENNDYDRVIRCRTGNFKPFEEDDVYIEEAK